jgi:hypothetical protein
MNWEDFKSDVSHTLLRRLRDILRKREIWISRDEKIIIEKALYNTLQKKNSLRWIEEEVLKCLSHENFIFIIIKILLKTNFDRKISSSISSRSVSSLSLENQSLKRQSISLRFSKFFQSSEISSVFFNRQLYNQLLPISSYRRSLISSLISSRSLSQSQLEEQSDDQSDEQSLRQSISSSSSSENQSTDRKSILIIKNSEHSPIIGNSEHVLITENSKHLNEPSDEFAVESSDESLVEKSLISSPSSSRPIAPSISVNQSGGQSRRQLMRQSISRTMSQLIRRSMNQSISDMYVRCDIKWIRRSLLNETRQWLLNNRANHFFKVISVSDKKVLSIWDNLIE